MRAITLIAVLGLLGCRTQPQLQPLAEPSAPVGRQVALLREAVPAVAGLPAEWRAVPLGDGIEPADVVWQSEAGVLRIRAQGQASMLARNLPALAAGRRLLLRWQWQVSGALQTARLDRKDGDDAAARVLVGFAFEPEKATLFERLAHDRQSRKSPFVPGTALCYVWAGHEEIGTLLDNPYNERVRVIVLVSGSDYAGSWQAVERDLWADYQLAFGEAPPPLEGVALMVDSDQTGEGVEGSFRGLSLSSAE